MSAVEDMLIEMGEIERLEELAGLRSVADAARALCAGFGSYPLEMDLQDAVEALDKEAK